MVNILLIIRDAIPIFLCSLPRMSSGFLPRIPRHKSFASRLPRRCVTPFGGIPLHYLLPFAYSKIVPILLQLPSQRLYWYY